MSQLIVLDEYRQKKMQAEELADSGVMSRPTVTKAEIWRRNFSEFDSIVFGLLKIKEILNYHLHYFEDWKHYSLAILDVAYNTIGDDRRELLKENITMMKQFLAGETNKDNMTDIALVYLILELIEKSDDVRGAQH